MEPSYPWNPQPHPCVEKQPQLVSTNLPGESIPVFSCSRLKLSWVGKNIDYPQDTDVTFKKAQRVRYAPSEKQKDLPMGGRRQKKGD